MTSLDVLYVGKDPEVIASLSDGRNLSVCVVSTGSYAIERIADAVFDCVVCDADRVDATELTRLSQGRFPVLLRTDDPNTTGIDQSGVERLDPDLDESKLVDRLRDVAADAPVALTDGSQQVMPSSQLIAELPSIEGIEEQGFVDRVLNSLVDFLFVADLNGNLLRWNDRFTDVTGYSTEEISSMGPMDFFADQDADVVERALLQLSEGGEVADEVHIVTKAGREIPFEITASLVEDESGAAPYFCGVGRDISRRRETEQRLDEVIEELERSNAELEQFAYVASHDMKEPLRMVSSYLELLDRRYGDDLEGDAQEFIEFAIEGANRMREMINGLLAYSRVGRHGREFETVSATEPLETAMTNLEITIEESGAEINVGDLPTIDADTGQLAQLFQNLIGNAIRYSGDETPVIDIDAVERDEHWEFSVADNGIGIPENRTDEIFDIFSRGESDSGSGIGLAICEKIAIRHEGEMWVESTRGEGSTFHFTIAKAEPSTRA